MTMQLISEVVDRIRVSTPSLVLSRNAVRAERVYEVHHKPAMREIVLNAQRHERFRNLGTHF